MNKTEQFIEKTKKRTKKTDEDYLREAREKFPQANITGISWKQVQESTRIKNVPWVNIDCPKHGKYEMRFFDFLKSKFPCKRCAVEDVHDRQKKLKSKEQFIEEANAKYNHFYNYDKVVFTDPNKNVEIICPKHGSFFTTPNNHLEHGCRKAISFKKNNTKQVVEKCVNIRGNKNFDYSFVVWGKTENINVYCKKHNTLFSVRYYDFLAGVNCPKCAKENQSRKISEALTGRVKEITKEEQKEFLEKAKAIRPEYDFSKTVYKGSHENISFNYQGKEYQIESRALLNGVRPWELSIEDRGIARSRNRWQNLEQELKEKHNGKYTYRQEEIDLIKSGRAPTNIKLHITCPRHGEFEQSFTDHIQGHGCPCCKSSKGEEKIMLFLQNNKVSFEPQKTYDDLKDKNLLSYDFYIPSINLLIEYNGEQHYKVVNYFGGEEFLHIQRHHDWMKRKYARKHNIELLIISYKDYYKIDSILSKIVLKKEAA